MEIELGETGIHITYPIEILIPIICLLLPVYFFTGKINIKIKLLDKLLLAFITSIGICSFFSLYPQISVKYLVTIIMYFTIGYVVPKVLQFKRKEWITTIQYLSFGLITLCLWSLVQFSREGIFYESSYNVSRPFINQGHTNLSVVLEPMLLITVGYFAYSSTKKNKYLALLLFMIIYAVIDYSWSRASYLTSTLSLIAIILLMNPILKKKYKLFFYSVCIACLCVISFAFISVIKWKYADPNWSHYAYLLMILLGVCFYISLKIRRQKQIVLFLLIGISIPIGVRKSYELIHEHYYRDHSYYDPNDPSTRKPNSIINVMEIQKPAENTSNIERIIRWKNGIEMFKTNPILGIGPGCFPDHQLKYLAENLVVDKSTISHFKMNIHNLYLAWLSEGGVVWFMSGIILIIYILFNGTKRLGIRAGKSKISIVIKRTGVIKRLLLIYFLVFIFHGIFQDFNNEPRVIIVFWLAVSLFSTMLSPSLINPTRQKG